MQCQALPTWQMYPLPLGFKASQVLLHQVQCLTEVHHVNPVLQKLQYLSMGSFLISFKSYIFRCAPFRRRLAGICFSLEQEMYNLMISRMGSDMDRIYSRFGKEETAALCRARHGNIISEIVRLKEVLQLLPPLFSGQRSLAFLADLRCSCYLYEQAMTKTLSAASVHMVRQVKLNHRWEIASGKRRVPAWAIRG